MFERVGIGLALGAGGARGLAHVGVLKALEQSGIKISFIAGSSMGALIGAAYAVCRSASEIEDRILEYLSGNAFEESGFALLRDAFKEKHENFSQRVETWLKRTYLQARFVARPAVLDGSAARDMIEFFLPKINIEDLSIPFWAMGTDIRSGRAVAFKSGPLQTAVYASSAIPGLIQPLELNELLIVDGGVIHMVPTIPARRMGADVVLAVDVEKTILGEDAFATAFDVIFRVEDVTNYNLKNIHARMADLVMRPPVGHIHWFDFKRSAEIIQLGKDEALARMGEIQALARRRKLPWKKARIPSCGEFNGDWLVI
ncbi:MAG: patatin-like phospholipase family protein [Pseudomonadota bacterium]